MESSYSLFQAGSQNTTRFDRKEKKTPTKMKYQRWSRFIGGNLLRVITIIIVHDNRPFFVWFVLKTCCVIGFGFIFFIKMSLMFHRNTRRHRAIQNKDMMVPIFEPQTHSHSHSNGTSNRSGTRSYRSRASHRCALMLASGTLCRTAVCVCLPFTAREPRLSHINQAPFGELVLLARCMICSTTSSTLPGNGRRHCARRCY